MPTVEEIQEKYGAIKGSDVDTKAPRLTTFSMSVEGLEGTGKTYFALMTCPTPIIHVNFGDRDAMPFLYEVSDERRAATTLYPIMPKTSDGWTREEGVQSLTQLQEIAKIHLSDGALAGGTFCLDSGSSWWEAIQEVYVAPEMERQEAAGGKRTGGLVYMKGNMIVNGVVNWIRNQGCFTVLTHRKKQNWDAQGPIAGSYSAQLNSKIPYLVDVRVDLQKVCAKCGSPECQKEGHIGRRHMGRIIKFGKNTALEGTAVEGLSFEMLYAMYAGAPFPRKEALL